MPTHLEAITRLIASIDTTGSFATCCALPLDDLHLEVKDVGCIELPVSATTARALCATGRPARHGFKDQTLLDRNVRDTWEIPKSRISIDQRKWKKTLIPALEHIRRDLGLPSTCRLEARLHNLLVYAPGQFFATHQDSEKADQMVGTLIVSLPSKFTGGSFVIEHHDETLRVGGSEKHLNLIAFYADCRHEVRPIRQGYRIVLTYNLVAQGSTVAIGSAPSGVEALTCLVGDFFETPLAPRWSGDARSELPDRLVYLLDHEYTQRGLDWSRLKNADAARASSLLEVARRRDCEVVLALADVHETWSCEDDYGGYGGRRGRYDDDEDDAEDEDGDGYDSDPGGYELTELIESQVELRHAIGPRHRTPEAITAPVDAGELCYTKPSVNCEPFETEHEGYTGNAGNTVDHWYHRAAIVLWPRERNFVIRSKASARWAVEEMTRVSRTGTATQALELARRVLPFWPESVAREAGKPRLCDDTLRLVVGLDEAEVAAALLAPFTLSDMTPKAASQFAELLERRGVVWCRALWLQWTSKERYHETEDGMLQWLGLALPAYCRALCADAISRGPAFAAWMLEDRWAWTRHYIKQVHENLHARDVTTALSKLDRAMLALIKGCAITSQHELRDQIVDYLVANPGDLPVQMPLGLLRAAYRDRRNAGQDLGLRPLQTHLVQMLGTRLASPERASDDWSIRTPLRCSCLLCQTLARFLIAPSQTRFEWPLAKQQRGHVHGVIDRHDLPLRHQTRRTGRPFTLVLEKTRVVFERDAAERRFWTKDLEWLARVPPI